MYPNPYGQPPMYPNQGYGQTPMNPMMPGMPGMNPMMPGMNPMMPGMTPGMNPMMPGMNPMMGQSPYAYRTMNFTGYHMNRYGINPYMIKSHAPMLFRKYDRNMSGSLDIMELYPLIGEFMTVNGLGYVNPQDINYLAYTFDIDSSGTIDYGEFKMMLKQLGGIKFYDRNKLMHKRANRHTKMMKYNQILGYGGMYY